MPIHDTSPPDPTDQLHQAIHSAIHSAIHHAQERHQLFPPATITNPLPVIVGVSGGADSLCLLHLLVQFAQSWNLSLHVAHLDHNVRPNSAKDAAFVQGVAQSWGLPFHTRRLTQAEVDATAHNLEAALRQLRYAFFADLPHTHGIENPGYPPTVAVAHTADDQAETILMHILRGSGLAGLAGMRPVSMMQVAAHNSPLRLVRPLLDVPHAHILQYLNVHNLPWREDPSNQDTTFARNRIRQHIIPQLKEIYPNLVESLSRLGTILAAESDRADHLDESALRALLQEDIQPESAAPIRVVLDRSAFRLLDLATQRGVLRQAVARLGLAAEEANFERIEKVRMALVGKREHWESSVPTPSTGPTPLAGGISWSSEATRFSLHQESALAFPPGAPFLDKEWRASIGVQDVPVPGTLHIGEWALTCRASHRADLPQGWETNDDPWQAVCDRDAVDELVLSTLQPGQRFAPLGMGGRHKQIGDFFTDTKTPLAQRTGWPLLLNRKNGRVVWLCGLRLDHNARVTPETEQVLLLKWRKRSDDNDE